MFGVVYKAAFADFLRPGRAVTWLAVGLISMLVAFGWARLWGEQSGLQSYVQLSQILVYRVSALVAAIFSAMVIAQELSNRTIVYLTTSNVPRPILLAARSLAAFTIVVLITWFIALCNALGTMGLEAFSASVFYTDLGVLVLSALAYGSLFVLAGLFFQKVLIFGLLFAFGWELFVPNMPGDLFYVSVDAYLKAAADHPAPEGVPGALAVLAGEMSATRLSQGAGIAVLVGIFVVLSALALVRFSQGEFVPKEETS
jgi:ABC-type transport system involved in multi-copper enzyme maturation permease subunit